MAINVNDRYLPLVFRFKLDTTQRALTKTMAHLGTGSRINSASEDAAGLQRASRLLSQINGMTVATQNTQNGISLLQTAEGSLTELNNILLRMKDLATNAADASSSKKDRDAMQTEYDGLGRELRNIIDNSASGGEKLLADETDDGKGNKTGGGKLTKEIKFQIGASSAETMTVDFSKAIADLKTNLKAISSQYEPPKNGGGKAAKPGTEFDTGDSANKMIDKIAEVINTVNSVQSEMGGSQNRLEHTSNNLGNMLTHTTSARDRIMNADYAEETANLAAQEILQQAGSEMLKRASNMGQLALSLLQR